MKKILILILLFPEILFCQNLAGDILKNVSRKTSSYKNIEAWISPFSNIFKTLIMIVIACTLVTVIYKTLRKLIKN